MDFAGTNDVQSALFVAPVGGSPSSMTVTVDPFTTSGLAYQSMVGFAVTEGEILQGPEGNIVPDGSTTHTTAALPVATTSGNLVIAGFTTHTTGSTVPTAPSGFTLLVSTENNYEMNTVFYSTTHVGTTVTCPDLGESLYVSASWIMEIETPAPPGPQSVRFNTFDDHYSRAATGLESSDFTMACWAYLSADRNTANFFLGADASSNWHSVGVHSDGTELYWSSTSGNTRTGAQLAVGAWYYVAIVYSASGTDTIYWGADGAALSSDSTTTSGVMSGITSGFTFHIGNTRDSEWWNGRIAQVKVWTAALSQAEIEAERDLDGVARTTNLWAYYSFRDGPQTNDESGNGRTLTAAGTLTAEAGPPVETPGGGGGFSGTLTHSGISGAIEDGGQTLTSSSFTPPANSTTYVWAATESDNHMATYDWQISNTAGLTYTRVIQTGVGAWSGGFSGYRACGVLFSAPVGGSPSAMTVTVDPWSTTNEMWWPQLHIFHIEGPHEIVQIVGNAETEGQTDTETHTTGTLGTAVTSGNLALLLHEAGGDGPVGSTMPSGWTNVASNSTDRHTAIWKRTDFTGTSETITDLGSGTGQSLSVLLEITDLGGGGVAAGGVFFGSTALSAIKLGVTNIAKAFFGSTQVWPIAAAPGMPTALVAAQDGDEITLTWTAPAIVGSSPITDYVIERGSLIYFEDEFNRANSADLGANWTPASGWSALNIVDNKVRASSGSATCVEEWSGSLPNDQWAMVDITVTGDAFIGLLLRGVVGGTREEVGFEINDLNQYDLAEFIGGVHNSRFLSAANAVPTGTEITVRGELIGNHAYYYVDANLIADVVLTTRLTGTRARFGTSEASGGTITTQFDNFRAGGFVPLSWTVVTETTSTTPSAVLAGEPNGRWVYRVAAVNSEGQGGWSAQSDDVMIGIEAAAPISISVVDDFNRTNATTLGANWEVVGNTMHINTNRAIAAAANDSCSVQWNTALASVDHAAEAALVMLLGVDTGAADVRVRMPFDTDSGYAIQVIGGTWSGVPSGQAQARLVRIDSGTETALTGYVTIATAVGTYPIKISAVGSTIKGYLNGIEILSATDSTHTGTYVGLRYYLGSTSHWAWDWFGVGAAAVSTPEFDPLSIPWHTAYWAEDPAWSHPADGAGVASWRPMPLATHVTLSRPPGDQPCGGRQSLR